jgi:hypothetical protein
MTNTKRYTRLAVIGLGAASLLMLTHDGVHAADHNEAPGTMADNAGDLADFYMWHNDEGKLVVAMTFAGLAEAGAAPTYDLDMLYGFHIDTDADAVADIDIWCRFGTNMAADEWGVQCLNIPGAAGPVEGAVETPIDAGGGIMLYAGGREDPFFFDLEGFQMSVGMGQLLFDSTRDFFAGLNVTAIVIEMDAATAAGDGNTVMQAWITSGRKAP